MNLIFNDSLIRAAIVGGIGGSICSVFGRASAAPWKVVSAHVDLFVLYYFREKPLDQCLLLGFKAAVIYMKCEDDQKSALRECSSAVLKGMVVVVLGQIALNVLALRKF